MSILKTSKFQNMKSQEIQLIKLKFSGIVSYGILHTD